MLVPSAMIAADGDPVPPPADLRLPLRVVWHLQTGHPTLGSWRAPLTGELFLAPDGRAIEARRADDGSRLWRQTFPTAVRMAAFVGDALLVGGLVGTDAAGQPAPDLHRVDPSDGRVLWSLAAGGVFAAPVAAGDRLIVGSTHALLAVDLHHGELAWRVPFERDARGLPGGPALAGPVLVDGLAIVGAGDARLHAFDAASGDRRWTLPLAARTLAAPAAATDHVICASADTLISARALDGRLRWRRPLPGAPAFASPALADGVAYVTTGIGRTLAAIEVQSGALVWETALTAPAVGRPALTTSTAWVADIDGRLLAVDRADGTVIWEERVADVHLSEPAIAAGRMVVGAADSRLLLLAPAPPVAPKLRVFPNPAHGPVRIAGGPGRLEIYDVLGRRAWVLTASEHGVVWAGTDGAGRRLPSGVYFIRQRTEAGVRTGRVHLLR